jgi:hypothetical protein
MRSQVVETPSKPRPTQDSPVVTKAKAAWPRLDRRALRRCGDDPRRIANIVAHRTSLPRGVVLEILGAKPVLSREDDEFWFG